MSSARAQALIGFLVLTCSCAPAECPPGQGLYNVRLTTTSFLRTTLSFPLLPTDNESYYCVLSNSYTLQKCKFTGPFDGPRSVNCDINTHPFAVFATNARVLLSCTYGYMKGIGDFGIVAVDPATGISTNIPITDEDSGVFKLDGMLCFRDYATLPLVATLELYVADRACSTEEPPVEYVGSLEQSCPPLMPSDPVCDDGRTCSAPFHCKQCAHGTTCLLEGEDCNLTCGTNPTGPVACDKSSFCLSCGVSTPCAGSPYVSFCTTEPTGCCYGSGLCDVRPCP